MAKVIGIDLGTTNSVCAVLESGEPRVVISEEGGRVTPSVVGFAKTRSNRPAFRTNLVVEYGACKSRYREASELVTVFLEQKYLESLSLGNAEAPCPNPILRNAYQGCLQ